MRQRGLASVAIVEQVFAKSLFCYLKALESGSPLLQAYEQSLGKILLRREILTFAGNTLKPSTEITVKILAYNSDKIPKATAFAFGRLERNLLPLYKAGAVVVEIGEKEYALVYKGERILQDYYNEKWTRSFYKELKKSFKIPEQLEAKLENFYKLIPKLSDDRKFWTCFNEAGTELRWKEQLNIEQSIKNAKASTKTSVQWEGEVAEAFAEIDEVKFVGTKVEKSIDGIFKELGDFDVYTSNYFIECKESLGRGVLNSGKFENQMLKYLEKKNSDFMNLGNKKVVVAVKSMGKGVNLKDPNLKRLFELAKKNNIELEFITNINQIKRLK